MISIGSCATITVNEVISKMRTNTLVTRGIVALFIVAALYLSWKVYSTSGSADWDFRHFWLAGKVWALGVSPYGSEYSALGPDLITQGYVPKEWYYPPNIWPVTFFLAQFQLDTSSVVWSGMNVVMLIGASFLLWANNEDGSYRSANTATIAGLPKQSMVFLHVFLTAIFQATAICLVIGQITILIYFGFALFIAAFAMQHKFLMILALSILFIKPQIAAPFAAAILFLDVGNWRLILAAGLVSIVSSLPPLLQDPMVLVSWLNTISGSHGEFGANEVRSITGIRHVLWLATGVDLGNIGSLLVTILATSTFGFIAHRNKSWDALDVLVVQLMVIGAFAPLHYYDLVILLPVALVLVRARGVALALALIGVLLLLRSETLAEVSGIYPAKTVFFKGTVWASFGAFALLASSLLVLIHGQASVPGGEKRSSDVRPQFTNGTTSE
ncbi:glycosyltransferase 87 family protein [Ruegeria sp. HKCCD4332]|uniref:glycosyltransferase 87 family protein n=1 Tax=Ruegeria sp. HKCCD4332 TaxID=2683021 RepID=UPI001492B15E|nr:glycosyltransferase 87 family protein [Ruegeria sp. HKCCD4332]NOD78576.1 DUF2029 domain-containing protein [Ruegeria sp. HKCCD4332]